MKIIVFKNGDHKTVSDQSAWEYANDPDWLATIDPPRAEAAGEETTEAGE